MNIAAGRESSASMIELHRLRLVSTGRNPSQTCSYRNRLLHDANTTHNDWNVFVHDELKGHSVLPANAECSKPMDVTVSTESTCSILT